MCNSTVPNVTLQTAVLIVVTEFAQQGKAFSAHDITTEIRKRTASGELEVPECEVNGASFRYDIPHWKVRQLFRDLWKTGVFDPNFTLQETFVNNTYFQYTPSQFTGTPSYQTAANPAPAPTPTTGPSNPPSVTSAPVGPFVKLDKGAVGGRVSIYLASCKLKGYRPTLKQVQSAIKRDRSTGWNCEELRTLIEGDLGYTVVDNPDHLSSAQVVV